MKRIDSLSTLSTLNIPETGGDSSPEGKWSSRISIPSESEIRSFRTKSRSPYIVCKPHFRDCFGYTEYAVDFCADYLPKGTYLSICNWDMDLSSLKRTNYLVYRDYAGVAAYAGIQALEDGRHVAIMSVWDTFCKEKKGEVKTIHAKVTYPDQGNKFTGEGGGIQCIVPYDYVKGRSYRALIRQSESASGTALLTFWICDLLTQDWVKLIEYDMNISETFMTSALTFLENFIPAYASDLRTMELWNFGVKDVNTGIWSKSNTASFYQCQDYPGSYNYGVCEDRFWVVTTALPNRCLKPEQSKEFILKKGRNYGPL